MIPRLFKFLFVFQMIYLAYGQSDTVIVLPGSDVVDGSIIKDYTNKWKVTFVAADGKETPNKIWTDYGQIIELNGEKYFHRVQDLYDPNLNLQETWINMVEHKSLAPVSYSRTTPSGQFIFNQFDGSKITGSSNYSSEMVEINTELDQSPFDWNLYGILLVGLPLEEGFTARLPFYSGQTNELAWLTVNVAGNEMLNQPNKEKVSTWKVTTDKNLTFWLTKTPPYVHRLELGLQNNAKLIWTTF